MFALEDRANQRVAGVCALVGAVGLREPFYSYRVGIVVRLARTGHLYPNAHVVSFQRPYRCDGTVFALPGPCISPRQTGRVVIQVAFLFMAQFREHFSNTVIAELRGV